ncbi:MAG: helix-turn-helix domain-containing protein [Bacteroidales bacterium]|nr:helix-turn-helix domain-containing protein [Bacteroidales bacterium]
MNSELTLDLWGKNRKPYFDDLPEIGSLERYCKDHFLNDYWESLQSKLTDGTLPVEKISRKVPYPHIIHVMDADIVKMQFSAIDAEHIHVEARVRASIYLARNASPAAVSDTIIRHYKFSGTVFFGETECDFSLIEQAAVFTGWDETPYRPLSEYLIPYIGKEERENEAEQILRRYFPEALEKPCQLNARILAKRIGLSVHSARLTPDDSLFGQIFFEEHKVLVYNDPSHPKEITVPGKTILVDKQAIREKRGGRIGQIVIHECVHYLLHRFFFRLQRLYLSDIQCIPCAENITVPAGSPLGRLERQNNQMNPRILMPAEQTQKKIAEFMKKEQKKTPDTDRLSIIERVIKDMSAFYGVSKKCARIRMIELGWQDADGVMNFCNGQYVPNYQVSSSSVSRHETFSISLAEAAGEYSHNISFRDLIDTNRFIYIESHFCLNTPKYILSNADGTMQLTDYARKHIDECCLSFHITSNAAQHNYLSGTLKREVPVLSSTVTFFPGKSAAEKNAKKESPVEAAARMSKIVQDSPSSFSDTLKFHMKRLHVTVEALAELSGVSYSTIIRARNGAHIELETIIALCIGLHLEPDLSEDLIAKANHHWEKSFEHYVYKVILRNMYYTTIETCNETLTENNMPPIP